MPEETTNATGQTAGEAGSSANSEATGNTGTATQNAGEKTFTQADIDRIVKDRLKDEQERSRKKAEEEDARKRGEWEKVAATEREKREAAENTLKLTRAETSVLREAQKANVVDPEAAFVLIQGKIEYDADGKPTNVDKLIAQLVKDKPYLLKQEQSGGGSVANPAGGRGGQQTDSKAIPSWGSVFKR